MPQIGIGGAEKQLLALIVNSGSQATHEVLYYSDSKDTKGYELYREAEVPLLRVPRNKYRPLRFLGDLCREIRLRAPDIVHCWLYSGIVWGRLAALQAGCRNILLAHRGIHLTHVRLLRILERLTSSRVCYLANSRACARAVAEQLNLSVDRFNVVYNGIEVERFQVPPERERLRREQGIPDNVQVVVTVGRLTAAKNYPMLLRVAQRCRGQVPVHFLIVGHGELESELTALARELEVTDIVHFLGLRLDIPKILASSDFFCYTSRHEGFPNALMEAMCAGLPIVSTNCTGAEELIRNGEHGLIVEKDDVDQAWFALRTLVTDRSLSIRLGQNAQRRVREGFSMEKMVQNTMTLYHKLLLNESGVRDARTA